MQFAKCHNPLTRMSTVRRLLQPPRGRAVAQLCSLRNWIHPHDISRPVQRPRSLTSAHSAASCTRHLQRGAAQPTDSGALAGAARSLARQPCRRDGPQPHNLRLASTAQSDSASTSTGTAAGLQLVIYSKDGCHLCDSLKARQLNHDRVHLDGFTRHRWLSTLDCSWRRKSLRRCCLELSSKHRPCQAPRWRCPWLTDCQPV